MGEGPRPEAGPVTENATFPAQHVGNFGLEEPSRVIALISVNPFNNVNHSQNDHGHRSSNLSCRQCHSACADSEKFFRCSTLARASSLTCSSQAA
jgi:hypothetical protein